MLTGQRWLFPGKHGKKKSAMVLSCLDCLDNFVGAKVTPSGEYFLNCRFRFARSADREGLVSANSIVSLCVRSDKVISLFGPKESMYLVKVLTSQVSEYLG